jgi:LmbE family N-acetylglucosaminyl deacetylase
MSMRLWERSPCRREKIAQHRARAGRARRAGGDGAGGQGAAGHGTGAQGAAGHGTGAQGAAGQGTGGQCTGGQKDEEAAKMPMSAMPEDWDRATVVAAHPDDIEYGIASAVARWTGQGKQVTYLLATRGEAGIAGMRPDQVGPLRVEEERRGAAEVGVSEVEFLDHTDGLVEYGIPLRRDLAAVFRKVQPEMVITMSFDLTWSDDGPVNHADHRAVGLAVLDACRDAANEWVFPEAGPRCDSIRDAYVAGMGNPTHFVDVTATIDAGVASLRQHQAYIDGLGRDFDPDQFLKDMAGYVGLGAGCEYAMSFHRYPMS